jgi:inorganic pyrophosphatase
MSKLQQFSSAGIGFLLLCASAYQLQQAGPETGQPATLKMRGAKQWVHPFDVPQGPSFPEEVVAVIEISQGSFTKYEIDPELGIIAVDRFQSMPVVYLANYGVITASLAGDGDNLDVLVLSREPIVQGALIRVRTIGVLKMLDGGEEDDKVIAVPTTQVDPTYDSIRTIEDLPAVETQRIEAFFRVYKQLPEGRKVVELNGFLGATEAKALIEKAIQRYRSAP